MRIGALVVLMSVAISCSGRGGLLKQYEYEEDMYVSLDGSATLYVNASIPALNALRGTSFDARPNARVNLGAVRAYFTTPVTRVVRASSTRRNARRFVHLRIEAADIGRLSEAAPFAWSTYALGSEGEFVTFRQTVGASAGGRPEPARWDGDEIVAFRLHLPSRIVYHNSPLGVQRGNILAWEQPLADRLRGDPVAIEVRTESESILFRTLLLFGATMVAVAITFGAVIWWVVRRGRRLQ
jgi:hypothetical protein